MALFVDLFGYLSIVLHGFAILAQAVALGGVVFLLLLARPLAPALGPAGPGILRGVVRITLAGACGLILCDLATIALQSATLRATLGLDLGSVMGADFARACVARIAAAAVLVLALLRSGAEAPRAVLLGAGAVILAAATLLTHAAARLEDRPLLLLAAALHQAGAAIWIGGLPSFVLALARCQDGAAWRAVGARFSRMSMAGVACIVVSATLFAILYIGDWSGLYGTAYGVMAGAKFGLFLMLLALGAMNFRLVERLRADPATPVLRLRRFAEAEIGLGIAVFFAAASLTSVPPAVDLTQDRVSWTEIVARNIPAWPRLASPDHDSLALPALQAKLDAEAARAAALPVPAFIPGEGRLPPRNADDIAWSEYNHHWSGLFMLAIGVLALLAQAGLRWARHWPALFLGLAGFLFLRSDPEVWPLGEIGLIESLRDVEVLQHRMFMLLIAGFGLFEWRVRLIGAARAGRAAHLFPLLSAAGGVLLLTHTPALANVPEPLRVELTHTPLALLGIAAGWARWLEIRLPGRAGRVAGWVWPVCFVLVGLLLLAYREA